VKSHVEAARAFLEGGVRIVQYRRKEGSIRVMLEEARLVRNLHPTGFKLVIVHRPEDVDKVDPTREAIVIGRTVGLRKRIEIVRRAIEKGVRVINVTKDVIDELSRSQ
jgi:large subunit ribosomal protein L32e